MLKVMTFNLRYGTAKDEQNSWEYRKDVMIEMLKEYHPDIIGSQESLKFQLEYITSEIPEYSFFGVSRRGNDEDEFSAIIYDSQKLKLLDGGNFWVSETPDIPGSKSWESSLPRMVTWCLLETKTARRFFHYNTHFDHRSEEARRKGTLLLWREIKKRNELPVILTGDFNSTNQGDIWKLFTGINSLEGEKPALIDAWNVARSKKADAKLTYHGFKGKKAEEDWKERFPEGLDEPVMIDWILFKGEIVVNYAEIVTYNRDGKYPSDHYPVYAELNTV